MGLKDPIDLQDKKEQCMSQLAPIYDNNGILHLCHNKIEFQPHPTLLRCPLSAFSQDHGIYQRNEVLMFLHPQLCFNVFVCVCMCVFMYKHAHMHVCAWVCMCGHVCVLASNKCVQAASIQQLTDNKQTGGCNKLLAANKISNNSCTASVWREKEDKTEQMTTNCVESGAALHTPGERYKLATGGTECCWQHGCIIIKRK